MLCLAIATWLKMHTHPKGSIRSRSTSSSSRPPFWSCLRWVGGKVYTKDNDKITSDLYIRLIDTMWSGILFCVSRPDIKYAPAWTLTKLSTNKNIAEVRNKCGCMWGASKCKSTAFPLVVFTSQRPSSTCIVVASDCCDTSTHACVCERVFVRWIEWTHRQYQATLEETPQALGDGHFWLKPGSSQHPCPRKQPRVPKIYCGSATCAAWPTFWVKRDLRLALLRAQEAYE